MIDLFIQGGWVIMGCLFLLAFVGWSLTIYTLIQRTARSGSDMHAPGKSARTQDTFPSCQPLVRMLATQRIQWIRVLAHVAPLLGLLGTVLGLMTLFAQLPNGDGSQLTEEFAAGIRQALLTTIAGLGIAIPLHLISSLLEARQKRASAAAAENRGGTRNA